MRLVEVDVSNDPNDRLPLVYDPDQINTFWSKRPVAVATRMLQLLSSFPSYAPKRVSGWFRCD